MKEMRLIDADALERDYRGQFDSVYKNVRDSVNPADFYIERKASYDKKLAKMEMEAFFEYLHSRSTIDAVPVVRCKDCLYGTPTYGDNYIRCAIWGEDIKNDKYCYCGKRRTVKRNEYSPPF